MDILLVEDNPADARLVREALAEGGVSAALHWVSSGEDALSFLRPADHRPAACRPDLVLLDLNLPGLNGHEVLAEIKRDPALLRIPVVVLTSSANPSDVLTAYGAHANAYLIKPEDYDEFLSLVGSIRNHWLSSVLLPSQVA
jgi:two-component system, chemotaxis family, response regulator Rcp1